MRRPVTAAILVVATLLFTAGFAAGAASVQDDDLLQTDGLVTDAADLLTGAFNDLQALLPSW